MLPEGGCDSHGEGIDMPVVIKACTRLAVQEVCFVSVKVMASLVSRLRRYGDKYHAAGGTGRSTWREEPIQLRPK